MVKFSHAIQLNSSPEWQSDYISYSRLKKIAYILEKAVLGSGTIPTTILDLEQMANITASPFLQPTGEGNAAASSSSAIVASNSGAPNDDVEESSTLLTKKRVLSIEESNRLFASALDMELDKIIKFYVAKEKELVNLLGQITSEITKQEKQEESYLHSLWISGGASSSANSTIGFEGGASGNPNHLPAPISTNMNITSPGRISPIPSSRLGAAKINPVSAAPSSSTTVDPPHPSGTSALDNYDLQHESRVDMVPGRVSLVPQLSFLPYLIWSSPSLKHPKAMFVKRLTDVFILLCDLRDYVEINETGFGKVLKKYEKVVGGKLKQSYLSKAEVQYPFLETSKLSLNDTIERLIQWYARIATDGKTLMAASDLKSHLREHIVWERNTIWRDMVEQERRRETIGFVSNDLGKEAPKLVSIEICGINIYLPRVIPTNILVMVFATIVLVVLTQSKIFPEQSQNNCFAILIFASIMWAFEAIPLFVTSMLIPFLVTILRVMTDHETKKPLPAKDAAKVIFAGMFGPVIMLLLGGFSLAAALSKHNIAKALASFILSKAGSKPHWVLLANMFVSTFASMWISNVAAPVLCFSLISPILRNLPHRSPYARCLVLGIAMAANVGGMASPIASPQNAISMGIMNPPPSWLQWFVIAIPMCVILDFCIWGVLLAYFRPEEIASPPEITAHTSTAFTAKQWSIIGICFGTICLWCAEGAIEEYVGDMGVIALIPIVFFYGSGILTKDDWNSMLWSVVMLAMGGISLGKAVDSSGLLHEIAGNLTPMLKDLSVFSCLALLSGIVVIVTSFISHTVGALIILPVVAQIGLLLPDPRPRTLVMASALMCSGGMALPVSSFPNMNAISLEDSSGEPWLYVSDFIIVGMVSSGLAWLTVVSLGYTVMTLLEFQ